MTKELTATGSVVREAQSQEDYDPMAKQKAAAKLSRIPIKVIPGEVLKKPDWIRVKAGSPTTRFYEIKDILRKNKLVTVCEEASCPNIGECFGKGTATFMIMGDKCTRRCPFCDVGHGRPDPLDVNEPSSLARTIADLKLSYVVITSVDRDDLRDGGAGHFVDCIRETRALSPKTQIEVFICKAVTYTTDPFWLGVTKNTLGWIIYRESGIRSGCSDLQRKIFINGIFIIGLIAVVTK